MKKRQLAIISFFLLILILIGWKLYSNYKANTSKHKQKAVAMAYAKVLEVENKSVPLTVTGYGRVTPSLSINIAPEVSGVVVHGDIPLKEGARFRKGQVLFKIDDREARLALKARKSSFLNLIANALADIKIDYPGSYAKWEGFFNSIDVSKPLPPLPGAGSTQEKTFLASRNILSEYYNIKKDEIRLDKYTVKAPFNGFFSAVMVQEGSYAGVGTPIATINRVGDLEVVMPIDKENIHMIRAGQEAELKTRDNNRRRWKAVVKRVAQQVNANTQSVNVYLEPAEDAGSLIPGMYLEADIFAGEISQSFELPRKALGNGNQVAGISDSLVYFKSVQPVKRNKESIVVKGLDNGELIITEQMPNIIEGQKIIPVKQP